MNKRTKENIFSGIFILVGMIYMGLIIYAVEKELFTLSMVLLGLGLFILIGGMITSVILIRKDRNKDE